ncbi:1320_t:CDS:2 [Paraglomus brasilianum]|uniref:1320_t:CDS:1 n=1 Tax=Paraglomus brasilianum TaxID=144538 RepID=A0A9N8W032_9GLOM|nr:1320_t:CDS:2 [Paraglomus brasilianum]
MDEEYESVLLVIRECLVYRIPPRTSSRGYRAQEWGDAGTFLWKGRLRVFAKGNKCFIRLEDSTTGELFAECLHDPATNSVEPVLDSSRYFVLRIEDKGRHAFIGIGFQERSEAFDFQVALQDHVKHVKVENETKERVEKEKEGAALPKMDFSLKEGETISINIGGNPQRRSRPVAQTSSSSGPDQSIPFLPPPPSAASMRQKLQKGTMQLPSARRSRSPSPNEFGEFMDANGPGT